ncbi:MAG TPA: transposase [Bacteroides reticulotermitis]|nr:transposase [Bacteroides reticulotermitis]
MSEAINHLVKHLITSFKPVDCHTMTSIIDSMPIITCGEKNKTGKVATEIATKGYCSTKNMYYFGLKLHALAFRRQATLPFPEMLMISSAGENDLTVLKTEAADSLMNRNIFADKIYSDFPFWTEKQKIQGLCMLTPVKAIKGEEPVITQREKAYRDLYSTAVSKIRQPIESLFNWINEKTNIQRAMKVRATPGLLIHTMGKMAIAFIYLFF